MSGPGAIETGLSRMLERFLALLLLAIFGTVVLLVILRYVFNTTVVGGNEGALIAFVYTTAIGGALAVARREHIEIRYFVDLMPAGIQRFLGVLQLALVAIVNFAIVWYSIVWVASTGSYLMPALQIPQIVAQLSVCIGSSLAFVYCLLGILYARGSPAPQASCGASPPAEAMLRLGLRPTGGDPSRSPAEGSRRCTAGH